MIISFDNINSVIDVNMNGDVLKESTKRKFFEEYGDLYRKEYSVNNIRRRGALPLGRHKGIAFTELINI